MIGGFRSTALGVCFCAAWSVGLGLIPTLHAQYFQGSEGRGGEISLGTITECGTTFKRVDDSTYALLGERVAKPVGLLVDSANAAALRQTNAFQRVNPDRKPPSYDPSQVSRLTIPEPSTALLLIPLVIIAVWFGRRRELLR